MIIANILASVLVMQAPPTAAPATQQAPATPAKKSAAIAVTKSADIGPTIDVPADLAALVPTDAVAVIFMPSGADASAILTRIASTSGPASAMILSKDPVMNLLKDNIKSELAIPLDQPLLWWVTMPVADENDPNQQMAGPDIRSFQAMKIPGATDKNIKSKSKRTTVTVLANDMVVVGAQKSAYEAPAAGSDVCQLLKKLPAGAVSGRLDLSTIMREQEETLRMGASFIGMGLTSQSPRLGKDATAEEKENAKVKQQMGAAISDQATQLVDLLGELKSASFSLSMKDDQLEVWTDWTRLASWPAAMTAQESAADLALLPAGLALYAGVSKSTMGITMNKQVTFDDAFINIGATKEQKDAWPVVMDKARSMIDMCVGGAAIGFGNIEGKPCYMTTFRVKNADEFQNAYQEVMEMLAKCGLYSDVKVVRATDAQSGNTMSVTLTPDTKRIKRIMSAMTSDLSQKQIDAIDDSAKPVTTVIHFKGNNASISVTPDLGILGLKVNAPNSADIRAQINSNVWGNTDWYATLDLRVIATLMSTQDANFQLPDGPPCVLSIRQGTKDATQRISISANIKSAGTLIEQYTTESARAFEQGRKKANAERAAAKSANKENGDDSDDNSKGDADDADEAPADPSMPGAP